MFIHHLNKLDYKLYELSLCEKLRHGDIGAETLFYRKMHFKKCRSHLCTLFAFAYNDINLIELFKCILNRSEFRGEVYGVDFISHSDEVVFFIGYEYEEKISYLELIAYMKRAIRIFLELNGDLKSNLDVYFMIKNIFSHQS